MYEVGLKDGLLVVFVGGSEVKRRWRVLKVSVVSLRHFFTAERFVRLLRERWRSLRRQE